MSGCAGAMLLLGVSIAMCGCAGGGSPNCTGSTTVAISPASGSADHSASPPGNEVQFAFSVRETVPAGCAVPAIALLPYANWTSSDPLDVTVSSANNSTNGLATCVNATSDPVTLTAVSQSGGALSATATLTCK